VLRTRANQQMAREARQGAYSARRFGRALP
jgi:hypothetical protein